MLGLTGSCVGYSEQAPLMPACSKREDDFENDGIPQGL